MKWDGNINMKEKKILFFATNSMQNTCSGMCMVFFPKATGFVRVQFTTPWFYAPLSTKNQQKNEEQLIQIEFFPKTHLCVECVGGQL